MIYPDYKMLISDLKREREEVFTEEIRKSDTYKRLSTTLDFRNNNEKRLKKYLEKFDESTRIIDSDNAISNIALMLKYLSAKEKLVEIRKLVADIKWDKD